MPHLASQQSFADCPSMSFLFKKKPSQEMILDIWLFWCQEMCDGSYFGFFKFTSSVLVVSPVVSASCTQILTNVAMTQDGEGKCVCGVWRDVSPKLPLIPRWDF